MPEAYIVDAIRTPVGKRGGGLAAVHPADLGAHVIEALLARTQVDPLAVNDVVFGCLDTVGPQSATSPAPAGSRPACPKRCRPHRRPAVRLLAAGRALRRPGGDERDGRPGRRRRRAEHEPDPHRRRPWARRYRDPFTGSEGWRARYGTEEISQFRGADLIAQKWEISRAEMEATRWPAISGPSARRRGRVRREIVPYAGLRRTSARAGTRPWRRWPG